MKLFFNVAILQSLLWCNVVQAILDGTSAPIEVHSLYTFTPFEWARGFVKFYNGFDIPPGSTIFLGVNQQIEGPIGLNGGTIIMEKNLNLAPDVTISDSGFFKTNNHVIFLAGNIDFSSRYFFSDTISFNGLGLGRVSLDAGGRFIILDDNHLFFTALSLRMFNKNGNNIIFKGVGDRIFSMSQSSLNIGRGASLEIDQLNILAGCVLRGINSDVDVLTTVYIDAESTLLLEPSMTLKTAHVNLPFGLSNLVMDSAKLNINRPAATDVTGDGQVFIAGRSILTTFGTDEVIFDPDIDLVLTNGARFIIESGTHFKFG